MARFYGRAHYSFLLFVTTQLLLYLHLYLLEHFELSLVGRRLLAPLTSHIDVVAHSFIGNCACITHESTAVGDMGGTGCD